MIAKNDITKILTSYNPKNIRIASLGGHSALDVCRGAKNEDFETVVVAERGREKTYTNYYKTRGSKGCVDNVILVDKFEDVIRPEIQKQLQDLNCVFIHSRYFWTYLDYSKIENNFLVPIFGNRALVRKEERDEDKNQYFLLQQAGIKIPRQFDKATDINGMVIVKAYEAARHYERAFFVVNSYEEYQKKSADMITAGTISEKSLKEAVIEEFVIGPQLNLNFFYSVLDKELELMGTDTRRQTNIDGLLRLTAGEQMEVLKHVEPKYIENGHVAVTIKESLIEKSFKAGEDFVKAVEKYYSPGMIGPFALQGATAAGPPIEEFVVFDVSMRIPGSPGTMFTPYTNYLYGESISMGHRIAKEIKRGIELNRLDEVVT